MNKLELCNRLLTRSGIAGPAMTTTISQTGELGLIVNLIDTAYEDIQDRFVDWSFLRHNFQFNCVVDVSNYAPSPIALVADWKRDSFRVYLTTTTNEHWLTWIDWDCFQEKYVFGSNRDVTERPQFFSIKPDKSVIVWPIPNDTYTINGEYYRVADTMDLDTDEPVFDRFHMAIVYNALMQYAGDQSLPTLYATAQKEYKTLSGKMIREYLPEVTAGASLA